jgi:hypothetical protein
MRYVVNEAWCDRVGQDSFDTMAGFNRVTICREQLLRDTLRHVFENRLNHSPFLTILNSKDGITYEGLKIHGWVHNLAEGANRAAFTQMELGMRYFNLSDISELQILH